MAATGTTSVGTIRLPTTQSAAYQPEHQNFNDAKSLIALAPELTWGERVTIRLQTDPGLQACTKTVTDNDMLAPEYTVDRERALLSAARAVQLSRLQVRSESARPHEHDYCAMCLLAVPHDARGHAGVAERLGP